LNNRINMASTEAVLDHHLTALSDRDLPAVMEDYTEESVIVTNSGTFRGLGEIEALFEGTLAEFAQNGFEIDLEEKVVEEEFAYIVWQAESPENVYEFATDTLYIPEDKIQFQTAAINVSPKN
jgi:ketosteroid isomerase-like protein